MLRWPIHQPVNFLRFHFRYKRCACTMMILQNHPQTQFNNVILSAVEARHCFV